MTPCVTTHFGFMVHYPYHARVVMDDICIGRLLPTQVDFDRYDVKTRLWFGTLYVRSGCALIDPIFAQNCEKEEEPLGWSVVGCDASEGVYINMPLANPIALSLQDHNEWSIAEAKVLQNILAIKRVLRCFDCADRLYLVTRLAGKLEIVDCSLFFAPTLAQQMEGELEGVHLLCRHFKGPEPVAQSLGGMDRTCIGRLMPTRRDAVYEQEETRQWFGTFYVQGGPEMIDYIFAKNRKKQEMIPPQPLNMSVVGRVTSGAVYINIPLDAPVTFSLHEPAKWYSTDHFVLSKIRSVKDTLEHFDRAYTLYLITCMRTVTGALELLEGNLFR